MAYVVLARKYRPRNFEELVGQPHVVTALVNALASKRLHHAYLFTGTRGVGKTTISRILAKSLNCIGADGQGGITAQPCGVCAACTEIDADRYIDYIELDAASNRGIDEIRDLLERAAYKPSVGRFKVFMIDEAHQLTKESFNALLKTLEEPPEYLKFVLATTDPDKMLPTVLSRCLQFNLRPMPPDVVHDHLVTVLGAEGIAVDTPALQLLARAARGSMRDALSLTDQALAYGGGQVTVNVVRTMLGSVDRGHALRLIAAVADGDGQRLLATVGELREHGLSALATLEEVAAVLQHMAVAQVVPDALAADAPDRAEILALAQRMPADEVQLLYSMALQGRSELELAPDEYAGLTMTLLRALAFAPAGRAPVVQVTRAAPAAPVTPAAKTGSPIAPPDPAEPPVAAPPAAAALASPRPAATARTVPLRVLEEPPPWVDDELPDEPGAPSIAAEPAVPPSRRTSTHAPTELGQRWASLVQDMDARGVIAALLRELAMQAELLRIDAGTPSTWTLRVERESLRTAALRDKLQVAVNEVLGEAIHIVLEAGVATDSAALRAALERERRQAQAEALIQGDPVVQQLLAQFDGARIVPGSIKSQ